MWYRGILNECSRGFLGYGFEVSDKGQTVKKRDPEELEETPSYFRHRERKGQKDRTQILFWCTMDAQNRVLVASSETNRRGYSLRILTGFLASQIIETEYEPGDAELQELLNARAQKLLKEQETCTE
jgi:hypothetical protein